jgi:hypothetical protein
MELFGPAEAADAHAVTDMAVTRAVVVPDTAAGHPAPHPVQAAAVTGAGAGAPHGTRIKMHTPERYDSTGDLESRLLPYSHPDDYFATIDAVRQPDVGGTEGS